MTNSTDHDNDLYGTLTKVCKYNTKVPIIIELCGEVYEKPLVLLILLVLMRRRRLTSGHVCRQEVALTSAAVSACVAVPLLGLLPSVITTARSPPADLPLLVALVW